MQNLANLLTKCKKMALVFVYFITVLAIRRMIAGKTLLAWLSAGSLDIYLQTGQAKLGFNTRYHLIHHLLCRGE